MNQEVCGEDLLLHSDWTYRIRQTYETHTKGPYSSCCIMVGRYISHDGYGRSTQEPVPYLDLFLGPLVLEMNLTSVLKTKDTVAHILHLLYLSV